MSEPRPARAYLETSAGGIVYRREADDVRILVIRDRSGHWGFPKGHLEPGETAEQAAIREIEEETGLGELRVEQRLSTIDWHFRFRGRLIHKFCHFFLIRADSPRVAPQRQEGVTACEWLSAEEAQQRVTYANARGVLREALEIVDPGSETEPSSRQAEA